MPKLPEDLPECMVFLLGKAYQKAHGSFKKQLKKYGLTNMQHLVLEGLWYDEGMTAAELCKLLIMDKATASGILERMEDTGWIIKKQDPDDGRVQQLYTSKKANDLKEKLINERKKANKSILKKFPLEEQLLLKRLLRDLI
jgi:DNA-binding MarR family transcriptional regulator